MENNLNFWEEVESLVYDSRDSLSGEDIYKLCVAHKNLDKTQKNWSRLAELLGVDRSGEALRHWTYRHQEEDGTVKRDITKLTDKTVDQLNPGEAKEEINKQLEEIYVAKTQVRDSWNAYRRTLRDEARVRSMMESVKEAAADAKALPAVEMTSIDPTKFSGEAIVMISDMHLGVSCDNYYNTYNEDIASQRLSTLVINTINYCKLHNVHTLHVINMGDMVQGIIHTNARLEQEFDITEQIMKAAELITEAVNLLRAAAPVVTYRSVLDNHSRAIANKSEHIEKENFNKIIDWYVESRLEKSDVIFPHDNIDEGIGMFTLSNGKKIMFSHGHEDRKSTVVQDMIGLTREWVDCILLAHYHNAAEHTFHGTKVYVNGSIVGTEQYAFGKRLFGEPSQKLLIFEDKNILDIDIAL